MAWPRVVPILEASDIYQGGWYNSPDGDGRSCLLGWGYATFGDTPEHDTVKEMLCEKLTGVRSNCPRVISAFNDELPAWHIARLWNSTVKRLGYTVPCER